MKALQILALASFAGVTFAQAARANDMIIGFGVGGGYDRWGRTLARHLGDHLPGKPSIVPKNMPGAGSLKAANFIYNVAPKDGTVIAIIARDAALQPIADNTGAKFDARKFAWIGSPTKETNVCIAYKTAPVKTVQDLFTKQLIVGDTGIGTGTYTYPKVLNALLGMKFKLIGGYKSSSNVFLAMERGEVQGICESYDSVVNKQPHWIPDGTVRVLFQAGAEPDPELKGVPFILDIAKTKEQKQALAFVYAGQGIGRPFVGPPGMSEKVVATLRKAFDETMKDPGFLADTKKQKLDVEPVSGEKLHKIIVGLYETPKPLVQKITRILNEGKKKKK